MIHYPSKILLFGEHIVNRGAQALAIPYPAFGGHWQRTDNFSKQQTLSEFIDYLEDMEQNGALLCLLDLDTFRKELDQGLYFESNIPVGYGLGSSGALCAAIYDHYGQNKIMQNEVNRLGELKKILAQLESFFHGTSSGTDPLICYLNQPIVIQSNGKIEPVTLPETTPLTFFLLDTKIPRSTEPLVHYFLQQCQDEAFAQRVTKTLVRASNEAVVNFLTANWQALFENMTAISRFQIEALSAMTPDDFHAVWTQGLQGNLYRLKMCGAGGGGFILGCTFDFEETKLALAGFDLQLVYPI